jgi:hypothetical protein
MDRTRRLKSGKIDVKKRGEEEGCPRDRRE